MIQQQTKESIKRQKFIFNDMAKYKHLDQLYCSKTLIPVLALNISRFVLKLHCCSYCMMLYFDKRVFFFAKYGPAFFNNFILILNEVYKQALIVRKIHFNV